MIEAILVAKLLSYYLHLILISSVTAIISYDFILLYVLFLTCFASLSHRLQLFSYRDIALLQMIIRILCSFSLILEYLINALLFDIT